MYSIHMHGKVHQNEKKDYNSVGYLTEISISNIKKHNLIEYLSDKVQLENIPFFRKLKLKNMTVI